MIDVMQIVSKEKYEICEYLHRIMDVVTKRENV